MPNQSLNLRPQQLAKQTLLDRNTFTTTLIVLLVDAYGTECFDWAPETIRLELRNDFGVEIPPYILDRIMAGISILTTNSFYISLPDFIELCNILSGNPNTFGEFDPADVSELAWGITETLLLSPPPEDDENPFSAEIVGYIQHMLKEEGIINPPDILKLGTNKTEELAKRIQYDFSDDPDLFASIWQFEAAKTDEINALIRDRLVALFSQLKALQLKNGNTQEVVKQMIASLDNRKAQSVNRIL